MTKTNWIGSKIVHKEITGSTNQDIRELALQGAKEGTVVYADMQTAGRGRRGRSWVSPKRDSLLFSLLLRPEISPDKASQITLLMALAVTKVLRDRYGLEAGIKWPNDIVITGKKVCGILTELYPDSDGKFFVIVGCGINLNLNNEELKNIDIPATSIYKETGKQVDKQEFLDKFLSNFENEYNDFLINGIKGEVLC